jgi:pSer/pThr/pTyr-binding forkhead associated (FHA) protein
MWILQTPEGPGEGSLTLRLAPGSVRTVGRSPVADFVVDASLVSRLHCRLTAVSDQVLQVEDLSSTNGTFVNDRRIETAAPLAPGDTLRIGRLSLTVSRKES